MSRERIQIIMEILEYAITAKRKTNIMYHVKLNYIHLMRHLNFLVDKKLLKIQEIYKGSKSLRGSGHSLLVTRKKYKKLFFQTTKEGFELVNSWRKIKKTLDV